MGAMVDGRGSASFSSVAQGNKGAARINSRSSKSVSNSSSKKKNTRKKKLNYNYREISAQILRARKIQSATAALIQARSKVASLQACSTNDQYDKSEISKALAHAKRMVNCARMKVDHMKEEQSEETLKKRRAKNDHSKIQKSRHRRQLQQEAEEKERALERAEAQLREQERAYRELIRKKKKHRNEENEKVTEANVKYLAGKNGTAPQYSLANSANSAHAILQLSMEAKYAAKELREGESETGYEEGAFSEAGDNAGAYTQMESGVAFTDAAALSGVEMDISI